MNDEYSDALLEAYLDEAAPLDEMARIEEDARRSQELRARLAGLAAERDSGVHSIAAIWRRHRLSCASREQWSAFLKEKLSHEEADDLRFHLDVIGCRVCLANVSDLRAAEPPSADRNRRFFDSSAGFLRAKR